MFAVLVFRAGLLLASWHCNTSGSSVRASSWNRLSSKLVDFENENRCFEFEGKRESKGLAGDVAIGKISC